MKSHGTAAWHENAPTTLANLISMTRLSELQKGSCSRTSTMGAFGEQRPVAVNVNGSESAANHKNIKRQIKSSLIGHDRDYRQYKNASRSYGRCGYDNNGTMRTSNTETLTANERIEQMAWLENCGHGPEGKRSSIHSRSMAKRITAFNRAGDFPYNELEHELVVKSIIESSDYAVDMHVDLLINNEGMQYLGMSTRLLSKCVREQAMVGMSNIKGLSPNENYTAAMIRRHQEESQKQTLLLAFCTNTLGMTASQFEDTAAILFEDQRMKSDEPNGAPDNVRNNKRKVTTTDDNIKGNTTYEDTMNGLSPSDIKSVCHIAMSDKLKSERITHAIEAHEDKVKKGISSITTGGTFTGEVLLSEMFMQYIEPEYAAFQFFRSVSDAVEVPSLTDYVKKQPMDIFPFGMAPDVNAIHDIQMPPTIIDRSMIDTFLGTRLNIIEQQQSTLTEELLHVVLPKRYAVDGGSTISSMDIICGPLLGCSFKELSKIYDFVNFSPFRSLSSGREIYDTIMKCSAELANIDHIEDSINGIKCAGGGAHRIASEDERGKNYDMQHRQNRLPKSDAIKTIDEHESRQSLRIPRFTRLVGTTMCMVAWVEMVRSCVPSMSDIRIGAVDGFLYQDDINIPEGVSLKSTSTHHVDRAVRVLAPFTLYLYRGVYFMLVQQEKCKSYTVNSDQENGSDGHAVPAKCSTFGDTVFSSPDYTVLLEFVKRARTYGMEQTMNSYKLLAHRIELETNGNSDADSILG